MGKSARVVWAVFVVLWAAGAAEAVPDSAAARVFCSRERPTTFVGSIELVRTPRLGREGVYRLHVGARGGRAQAATLEWILPDARGNSTRPAPLYVPDRASALDDVVVRVDRPGDYQIAALVRPADAPPGSPADVFVRYLRVRPDGSHDATAPFPYDSEYAAPFAPRVTIRRQAGVGAREVAYSGALTYHDDNTGFQEPIREAQVRLAERVTDGPFLIEDTVDTVMTDADGRFAFPAVAATTAAGEPRVFRLRAILDNDTLSLSPASGGAYERDTEWADAEAGASLEFELRWERQDASHMAGHVFTAVLDARDFLIDEVAFTRDKIRVHFPSNQSATFYAAEPRRNGALSDEWIDIAFEHGNDRTAMLHEYGHAVMTPLYGNTFDAIPFGQWEAPHALHTVSDEEFAISEGWAEFMAAAVDDDALNVTSFDNVDFPNIETNFWYTGRVQGVGGNTIGERVEGSVASVLWDISDGPQSRDLIPGTDDDGIVNDFERVWAIFGEATPYTILTVREEWLRRGYPMRDELMAIFDQHSMTGLDPSSDVNRDGIVDIADIVAVAQRFGEEGPFPGFSPDVNGDDVISIADLVTVARDFGSSIPLAPAAIGKTVARTLFPDAQGVYALSVENAAGIAFSAWPRDSVTVEATGAVWSFAEAGRAGVVATGAGSRLPTQLRLRVADGSGGDVALRGIEVVGSSGVRRAVGDVILARGAAADVPAKTALRPNFPNPFNPETWIPFDLARASSVVVTVYDSRGIAVRAWNLGRLGTGSYGSREGAIHWDGRDATGEAAASGAYYVELRAGADVSVRRLLLAK
ncbi:hypothetical protein CMK11_21430 [Candidatus Poribacteria bacterium]|nr:hypothetical protein [Candidatus Poribacteria bacterium]